MPLDRTERLFIIDTNAYFRLADSFHPLIGREFGNPPCIFRVVPDLDGELRRNPRLSGKFHWASSEDYVRDRRRRIRITEEQKDEIRNNLDHLREAAYDLELVISPVDLHCLALALSIGAVVVTDDNPMALVAAEFDIPIVGCIDLMKLMLDEGRASTEEIADAVAVIEQRNDIPAPKEFWKKYQYYFGGRG